VLTCTSPTASAEIRKRFGAEAHHAYLPFDTPGAVRRFMGDLSPRLLLLMETELWPHLLREAQRVGTSVVVANARLSARSAGRYARFGALTRRILADIDLLLVQDESARERFAALGMAPARVQVTGSLKYDSPLPPGTEALQAQFRALTAGRPLWVAASTHEGEEAAALAAQQALRARWPDLLLVLVPRHPQRFAQVRALLQEGAATLPWQARSDGAPCNPDTAVLLGDAMGELRAWLGLATLAFMGGTLIPRGGHNPMEVIEHGVPLASGRHVFNFAEVFGALDEARAVAWVEAPDQLGAVLAGLLDAPERMRTMAEAGRALHARERGATARSLAPIEALLARSAVQLDARVPQGWVRHDPALLAPPARAGWFDAESWPGARPLDGGRGRVWFVPGPQGEAVLRHYHRGGLVGKLLGDRYLPQPREHGRAMAEHALLRRMRAWDLPVPRPCAALLRRGLPMDRHDILVQAMPGAIDLARRLQRAPQPEGVWVAIGRTIARLHAHGVFHSDLNCHNLLLDDAGQVAVIDFDKCELRAPGPWMQANLQRLLRSLRKEQGRLPAWHWSESRDWPALLRGYDERPA
jgi:3-deoxy-D-manno-octulosonic-acid transferase